MKLGEIVSQLNLETIVAGREDAEISEGYTSDLLSDVMGNAADGCVLITIQAHKNTVAVASLKDMKAIIVCNGRPVADDMVTSVRDEGIGLYRTPITQFEVSGKVYALISR